jgi:hypothetical protein
MAYSYTAFTGNGSTTQYAVAFAYIRREHVAVTVAGIPATFTWVNNSLIQMDAAPANGAAVRVYRTTPIDAPLVDFADGATWVAADLDTNSRQSIYIQQELDDAQTDNLPNLIPNGNKGDITTSVGGTVWAINNGAVTSAKILDGAILDADVNASAGITAGKLSFTQAGTGATARTVDSKLKDVVSVKDFGAVGDGVTDDTAAINLALAASTSVFFPAGTYLTSGNHNIKEKSLFGGSKLNTIIKLSGINTNSSLFINGESISTPWGSGQGCQLRDLTLRGNWDGSTVNSTTNISSIGALLKWWSGAYVQIERCTFQQSFGFGIFSYRLGYSYINTSFISTNAKNGIHLEAPSGAEAITSTTINDCSVNSCRGRSVDAATGGSGVYIKNGFYCNVNGCVIEDLDDGIRIDGNDNRSITIFETHIETVSVSCVNYAGSGQSLMLFQNIFATAPAIVQSNPAFNIYQSIGNFGLETVYTLPVLSTSSTQIVINNATPRVTMASVTLTPGTWLLTGAWNGSAVGGLGQVSTDQAYVINTSAAIPGYSSGFSAAVFAGDRVSPINGFSVLQGSLSLQVTVTTNTTYYLYGGPSSITSTFEGVLAGHLKAVKVNGPYL